MSSLYAIFTKCNVQPVLCQTGAVARSSDGLSCTASCRPLHCRACPPGSYREAAGPIGTGQAGSEGSRGGLHKNPMPTPTPLAPALMEATQLMFGGCRIMLTVDHEHQCPRGPPTTPAHHHQTRSWPHDRPHPLVPFSPQLHRHFFPLCLVSSLPLSTAAYIRICVCTLAGIYTLGGIMHCACMSAHAEPPPRRLNSTVCRGNTPPCFLRPTCSSARSATSRSCWQGWRVLRSLRSRGYCSQGTPMCRWGAVIDCEVLLLYCFPLVLLAIRVASWWYSFLVVFPGGIAPCKCCFLVWWLIV